MFLHIHLSKSHFPNTCSDPWPWSSCYLKHVAPAYGRLLTTVLQNTQWDALSKELPPDLQKKKKKCLLWNQDHLIPFLWRSKLSWIKHWQRQGTALLRDSRYLGGSICAAGSSSSSWVHLLSSQLAGNEAGASGKSPSCFLYFCSSLGLQ